MCDCVPIQQDFEIETLGSANFPSPLTPTQGNINGTRVYLHSRISAEETTDRVVVECAGPRDQLFFKPDETTAAIITCGGLCPGLNNVIRALVLALWHRYGITRILGIRYGYEGLTPNGAPPLELTPEVVKTIHEFGGTILGSSRGPQDLTVMAASLQEKKVNVLFAIGGDGTLKGALALSKRCVELGYRIGVVGVPKTIDNDVCWMDKTFGFDTAVCMAQSAISAAHAEAKAFTGGIGIVKLMGRESGFIALHASLASGDVNMALLPEVPFSVEKVADFVQGRIANRGHCVIVIAEGAGLDLFSGSDLGKDASGNKKMIDVGVELSKALSESLRKRKVEFNIKYIDPSYTIRSAKANTADAILCLGLAHAAAHAGMAGKTNMVVSLLHGELVHIPIQQAVAVRKRVDVHDILYQTLLDGTGMPNTLI